MTKIGSPASVVLVKFPKLAAPSVPSKKESSLGAVNAAFAVGERLLFLEGWVVASGTQIARVSLAQQGAPMKGYSFECFSLVRQDVAKVHAQKLQRGARCFGYRLLVQYPAASQPPVSMELGLDNGQVHPQELSFKAASGLSIEAKLKRLTEASVEYGSQVDLPLNTEYRRKILDPCRAALRSKPTAMNRAEAVPPSEKDSLESVRQAGKLACRRLSGFVRAHVDWATQVGEGRFFIRGWLVDRDCALRHVAVCREGQASENLLTHLPRLARPDVLRALPEGDLSDPGVGFVLYAELNCVDSDAGRVDGGGDVQLLLKDAEGVEASVGFFLQPLPAAGSPRLKPFLEKFTHAGEAGLSLLQHHVGPALAAAWQPPQAVPSRSRVVEFGTLPNNALCTVVVPLFARFDFLLYQIASFSRDPDFAQVELVYVVDDPSIWEACLAQARETFALYCLPFRLVYPGGNLGFAGANNFAVAHSTARLVLLLNSDVAATRHGWLSEMTATFADCDRPGVLGVRLLFEDGTIQHDGIGFERRVELPGLILNDHPGKGLPPRLAPTRRLEEVCAVTAACMLTSRETYLALGGLDEGYIRGDFEDSDFCLAARAAGLRNYLLRLDGLYHLERQSISQEPGDEKRQALTLYNAWRHTTKWQRQLVELVGAEA